MADLSLVCTVTTPTGSLNLEAGPYSLERTSFEEVAVSWRKQEVSNPWVEGSYVTGAVKENVVRPLNVWVAAATPAALKTAVDALKVALDQLSFEVTFGVTGATETWRCSMAEYAVRQEQGYRVANTALVRAQVPTKPTPL